VDVEKTEFNSGEILNRHSDLEIKIKDNFGFNAMIQGNLDRDSDTIKTLKGINYHGFLGMINKMSLSNEEGQEQIILTNIHGKTLNIFLFYKGPKGIYIIMVTSDKTFDEKILDIFNFS